MSSKSKLKWLLYVLVVAVLSFGSLACGNAGALNSAALNNDEVAVIETSYGRIVIEFLPDVAPQHVLNFKELARTGFYDGTHFHRLVKTKTKSVAIQGGDPTTKNPDQKEWGKETPGLKKLKAEFSQTLKMERGVVAMARKLDDNDSATTQFFIVATYEPTWDGKYTIFGRVIEGMTVVDAILRAPIWPRTERPMDPVKVERITLRPRAEF